MDLNETLEKTLKQVGKIALILHGLAFIILILGLCVVLSYYSIYFNGKWGLYQFQISGLIPATFLLITGIFLILAGKKVGKGNISNSNILRPIIMFSIYLLAIGIIGIILWSHTSFLNNAILYIISAVLMISGSVIYVRNSTASKVTGAIIGIVAIALLFNGGDILPYFLTFVSTTTSLASGIISSAFIVTAVAAMMYPFLKNSRFVTISFLIVMIGFTLYGIGIVIPTLSWLNLSSDLFSNSLFSIMIMGTITMTVSGFLILASSGIGIALFLRRFITFNVVQMSQDTQFYVCPRCGGNTEMRYDKQFCARCSTYL